MCGLSGSGKTFNSKILGEKLGSYVCLNLGSFREQLGITSYSRKDTPKLLAMVIDQIEKNYHNSIGSILDANLKSVDLRQCFYDLARHLGEEVIVVELVCSDEETRQRMAQREQITLAENPKDFGVFLEQKKVWQDTLLDLGFEGNKHVVLIRFNTEKEEIELMRGNDKDNPFLRKIIEILKNK